MAKEYRNYNYYLFAVDIPSSYILALKSWKFNLFKEIFLFITDKLSIFKKIASKQRNISAISLEIQNIKPSKIIIGNNRKNEFSATIYKFKDFIDIEYLDDGIHSYILESSSFFKYTFLDSLFKSILYKNIITTPKYIAVDNDIKAIYLFKPELRHKYLLNKRAYPLDSSYFKSDEFKEFLDNFESIDLDNINSILLLPHRKEIDSKKLAILVDRFDREDVAIKFHPRDKITIYSFKRAKLIPNSISSEILILDILEDVKVYGFKTTSILMGKWLRGDLEFINIVFNDKDNSNLNILMKKSNIISYNIS